MTEPNLGLHLRTVQNILLPQSGFLVHTHTNVIRAKKRALQHSIVLGYVGRLFCFFYGWLLCWFSRRVISISMQF
jgi:hypothetical protein